MSTVDPIYVQQLIRDELNKLREMLLAKNKDYGCSVFNVCPLIPDAPPEVHILARMWDKIERLKSLASSPNRSGEVQESFEDTIRDLWGYCTLYLVAGQLEGKHVAQQPVEQVGKLSNLYEAEVERIAQSNSPVSKFNLDQHVRYQGRSWQIKVVRWDKVDGWIYDLEGSSGQQPAFGITERDITACRD